MPFQALTLLVSLFASPNLLWWDSKFIDGTTTSTTTSSSTSSSTSTSSTTTTTTSTVFTTSTSTSTTSTTSTSTTTLGAFNVQIIPGFPSTIGRAGLAVDGTMICAVIASPGGISNATSVAVGVISPGGNCGIAIYPDSDGVVAPIFSTTQSCPSPAGIVKGTGSAFTLTANINYRFCICADSSTTYLGLYNGTTGSQFTSLVNTFTSSLAASTAKCTAGVPPNTGTGAMVVGAGYTPPFFRIE